MTHAIYAILEDTPGEPLVIKDVGSGMCRSITNDAEWVVSTLIDNGVLTPGRRLLYYDSMGQLDEILIKDGEFAGFAPGPR